MIKLKDINKTNHSAEILLMNTTIKKILKEYNEAVALTQNRLQVRKLYPIEKKDIQVNTVNIFSGGNTSSSYIPGVGYVSSEASLGLIAIEKSKRFGLNAKIHIIRTGKAHEISESTFQYNVENGFYHHVAKSGICKYYKNDKSKIAHYIIFKDRVEKYSEVVLKLFRRRVEKIIHVDNASVDEHSCYAVLKIGGDRRISFEYSMVYNEFRITIDTISKYNILADIKSSGFPTSSIIKEKLVELFKNNIDKVKDSDALITVTAILSKHDNILQEAS